VVHVVAVGHLHTTAPVVCDHAVAAPEEEHYLGIPVVGRERPAVAEDDRLAWALVLVEDLGAVRGGDRWHVKPFRGSRVAFAARPTS